MPAATAAGGVSFQIWWHSNRVRFTSARQAAQAAWAQAVPDPVPEPIPVDPFAFEAEREARAHVRLVALRVAKELELDAARMATWALERSTCAPWEPPPSDVESNALANDVAAVWREVGAHLRALGPFLAQWQARSGRHDRPRVARIDGQHYG